MESDEQKIKRLEHELAEKTSEVDYWIELTQRAGRDNVALSNMRNEAERYAAELVVNIRETRESFKEEVHALKATAMTCYVCNRCKVDGPDDARADRNEILALREKISNLRAIEEEYDLRCTLARNALTSYGIAEVPSANDLAARITELGKSRDAWLARIGEANGEINRATQELDQAKVGLGGDLSSRVFMVCDALRDARRTIESFRGHANRLLEVVRG